VREAKVENGQELPGAKNGISEDTSETGTLVYV
jgi:hypothetical protein